MILYESRYVKAIDVAKQTPEVLYVSARQESEGNSYN